MPNMAPKIQMKFHGFSCQMPSSEKMLLTPIIILPPHEIGENVSSFPGQWTALWDTGAQSSTISTQLAENLKLPTISERIMTGAGGQYRAKEYLAGLMLPNRLAINAISLFGFCGSDRFDLLIGMDIISQGDFLVSSSGGTTYFSFQIPSLGGFDLSGLHEVTIHNGNKISLPDQSASNQLKKKIGWNDPCPCGSGKKFKKCHGRNLR